MDKKKLENYLIANGVKVKNGQVAIKDASKVHKLIKTFKREEAGPGGLPYKSEEAMIKDVLKSVNEMWDISRVEENFKKAAKDFITENRIDYKKYGDMSDFTTNPDFEGGILKELMEMASIYDSNGDL